MNPAPLAGWLLRPRVPGRPWSGKLEDTCTPGAYAGGPALLWPLSLGHFGASFLRAFWGLGISPGLGVSLVSPSVFLPLRVSRCVPTLPFCSSHSLSVRVTPKESWLVGSEGPAHFSQHQAARTRVFPPRGWYGQWQGGMEGCPARRMLLLVGVPILSFSGQVPLRALCSLPSAEPGLRRGDTGLPGTSHQDKSKAPNSPQRGTPTVCLCINQATWLLKNPLHPRQDQVPRFLAWQFRALPAPCSPFPPLFSPLVFTAPSFTILPPSRLQFLCISSCPQLGESAPSPHLSSNVSSSGKSSLICLSK